METKEEMETIEFLISVKNSLPPEKREQPIIFTFSGRKLTISDMINEIKTRTRFGQEFVKANMTRLQLLKMINKEIKERGEAPEKPTKDEKQQGQDENKKWFQ